MWSPPPSSPNATVPLLWGLRRAAAVLAGGLRHLRPGFLSAERQVRDVLFDPHV